MSQSSKMSLGLKYSYNRKKGREAPSKWRGIWNHNHPTFFQLFGAGFMDPHSPNISYSVPSFALFELFDIFSHYLHSCHHRSSPSFTASFRVTLLTRVPFYIFIIHAPYHLNQFSVNLSLICATCYCYSVACNLHTFFHHVLNFIINISTF